MIERFGIETVLLSGGCFQNRVLTGGLTVELTQRRHRVYRSWRIPITEAWRSGSWLFIEEAAMCLGVPGRVEELLGGDPLMRTARVNFEGITQEVSLAFVPEAIVGDYVIVHAGFGLSKVNEDEAKRIFAALAEIGELEKEPA